MIELLALIFLTKEIGKLAILKGLPPGRWKFICVLSWFLMEIVGIIAGMIFFGKDNLVSIVLVGLGFAVTGYFMVKNYLQNLPDINDQNKSDLQ